MTYYILLSYVGFPEIGVPPVIIHFWMGFSITNQPFLGYLYSWKLPIYCLVLASMKNVTGCPGACLGAACSGVAVAAAAERGESPGDAGTAG